ncbi:hypothetical protein OESDEN_02517 [Oesophagostomum dentatum]|uniref:Uncharacterized protein n=1 Tax=Oesophagostomum dentatum TaxID=61180 RepID=A0A0B1TQ26_OESDE|nr:hypothetical protein OESDEN_02517 [Oesophagostomum dentatum]
MLDTLKESRDQNCSQSKARSLATSPTAPTPLFKAFQAPPEILSRMRARYQEPIIVIISRKKLSNSPIQPPTVWTASTVPFATVPAASAEIRFPGSSSEMSDEPMLVLTLSARDRAEFSSNSAVHRSMNNPFETDELCFMSLKETEIETIRFFDQQILASHAHTTQGYDLYYSASVSFKCKGP